MPDQPKSEDIVNDNLIMDSVDKFYGKPDETEQPATPAAQPTESSAVTKAGDQDPPDGSENLDKPDDSGNEVKKDPDKSDELDADGDQENVQYLDLDDKEHSLDEVRTWRDGHMMQSDYTKKTQALAEERKTFKAESESERENLLKSQSEVTEMRDQLAALIEEDEEIDWVELKESDPETYIKLKETADKRKAALEKVKADRATPADDPALIATEQGKMFATNPDWVDSDNKITQVFIDDRKLMNEYAVKAGFDLEDYNRMSKSHYLNTILKAAKWEQIQEKGRKIKADRDKVTVVTRPKASDKSGDQQPREAHEIMYDKSAAG